MPMSLSQVALTPDHIVTVTLPFYADGDAAFDLELPGYFTSWSEKSASGRPHSNSVTVGAAQFEGVVRTDSEGDQWFYPTEELRALLGCTADEIKEAVRGVTESVADAHMEAA